MLTYGAQQLASSFRTVRKNTIQVAQDIPEDKYAHVPAEGARTVGRMLTHVAIAPTRLWQGMHGTRSNDMTGFDFFGLGARMQAEEATPRTKAEIVELLTTEGEAFAIVSRRVLGRRAERDGEDVWRRRALGEVSPRDADGREGARDAPPRAAHAHRTSARHHPAPHAADERAHRADGEGARGDCLIAVVWSPKSGARRPAFHSGADDANVVASARPSQINPSPRPSVAADGRRVVAEELLEDRVKKLEKAWNHWRKCRSS